jgi:Na+-translocating ferredoxin:NAD+ oxidoreductase RnfG subunit
MDYRFILLPASAIAIAAPVHAEVFLTIEQAQASLFPGATFAADLRTLTADQASAIEKDSGVDVRSRDIKAWRASTGGWFIVDEAVGKHDFIPFALALDKDGTVQGLEILEYREAFGNQVRNQGWRNQFKGKRHGASLTLTKDIQNISGATLSCRHLTDGVKRLLATYAIVFAKG